MECRVIINKMKNIDLLIDKTAGFVEELKEIEYRLHSPEVLADIRETKELSKKREKLDGICSSRDSLVEAFNEEKRIEALFVNADSDEKAVYAEIIDELRQVEYKSILKLLSLLLPEGGEVQKLRIEFKPLGNDSVFADRLVKMYVFYAERCGLSVSREGLTIYVNGKNAWMYLDSATCVHKLYDVKSQTVEVKVFEIFASNTVKVNPDDVRVDIYLAHGKGGQNINKVETAVRLTHLPTGVVVTCQDERSQLKNKERAFKKLAETLTVMSDGDLRKKEDEQQLELMRRVRLNQRVFNKQTNSFTDSRVKGLSVDLDDAYKGVINEIVEAILIDKYINN